MQSGFDPYREWLDIPDAVETPNHYRLLGLRLFEDDPNRIAEAVARIGQVLVRQLSGPHQLEAKRLLGELDLARGCLSDPAAKQQYDQLLRAELLGEPVAIAPKASFISQLQNGPMLPPTHTRPQDASLRSTFNSAPAGSAPLPPGAPLRRPNDDQPSAPSPAEPAMRVTVQQAAAPLMPPSVATADAPAAMPPSAFVGKSVSDANLSVDDPDDMLPPAALPNSFAAVPPALPATPVAPTAYAIPMATPAQPYGQPAYAQPLQAQPIYPTAASPPLAVPLPAENMAVAIQAAAYVPQATPFAAGAPLVAEPMMAGGMAMGETPVVASARRSWRSRSSSPTALYIALPIAAVIVLLAVIVYNNQAGSNGESGDGGATAIAQNPRVENEPLSEPALSTAVKPPEDRSPKVVRRDESANNITDGGKPQSTAMSADVERSPAVTPPPTPAATTPAVTTPAKPEMPAVVDAKTQEEVRQTLAEARAALGERKFELAKAKVASARKSSGGAAVASEVERVDALVQYVEGFWKGVDEQIKGLVVGDQTTLRDKTVGVVDKDAEKLILRVDGENRSYARDDLPIGVAIGLAEAWFNKDDPASMIFLGSIHLVHPKGDRNKARELWQQASAAGKQREVELVLPELDVPLAQAAAMAAPVDSRLPPKPAELTAAKTEVRQMFEADLSEATDGAAKVAVAQKMFRRADEGGDSAAIRFALLTEAAQLAAEGADFEWMSAAVNRLQELFEIDAMETRSDLLFAAAKSVEGADGNQKLAQATLVAYDEAVLLEQFDQASKLARIALGAARKSGNSELIKECSAREKEARELNKK